MIVSAMDPIAETWTGSNETDNDFLIGLTVSSGFWRMTGKIEIIFNEAGFKPP